MGKSVYIIVINWNGWKDTIECLESIQRNVYDNYRIILIDNGSNDNSIDIVKSWAAGKTVVDSIYLNKQSVCKPIHIVEYDKATAEIGGITSLEAEMFDNSSYNNLVIIKNIENIGFAAGCNIGIRYALESGAEYVWLLNNDTFIEKESLSILVNFQENNKDIECLTWPNTIIL